MKNVTTKEMKQVLDVYFRNYNSRQNKDDSIKDAIIEFLNIHLNFINKTISSYLIEKCTEYRSFKFDLVYDKNLFKKIISFLDITKSYNQALAYISHEGNGIFKEIKFNEDMLNEIININGYADELEDFLKNQKLSSEQLEKIIEVHSDTPYLFYYINKYQKLDMNFINKHENNFDIYNLINYQKLDLDFIKRHNIGSNYTVLANQDIDEELYQANKRWITRRFNKLGAKEIYNRFMNNPNLSDKTKKEIDEKYIARQVAQKLRNAK